MTPDVCLDANVFIAIFSSEPSADVCRILLERLGEKDACYYEPALTLFEITSALQRKVANGEMSMALLHRALDHLNHLPMFLQWQSPLLAQAAILANTLRMKNAYDTTYLAVAISQDIPFITFDEQLRQRGREVHQKVYTVQEFLASHF